MRILLIISDLNEKNDNKILKIMSQTTDSDENKKVYNKIYKKMNFYLLAKKIFF